MDTEKSYYYTVAHLNYAFTIEKTHKKIKQNLQKRFNRHGFDITVDQWVVLDQIYTSNGVSPLEIATSTYKDAPTVTRILEQLRKKELVYQEHSEEDRRKTMVYPSEKGLHIVPRIREVVIQLRKDGWVNLSDQDYENLMRISSQIMQNMDATRL
jgi:DNA-binding MarR family transcriptional regulator